MKDKIIKLSNGGVLLYGKSSLCNATAVELGFCVGAFNEKHPGTAHLLEHTLFKKTTNRSNSQVELDRNKLAHLNASTGMDFLAIKFFRTNKLLGEALDFSCDLLLNSVVDEEYFESEKNVVKQELSMCKDNEEHDCYVKNFTQALSKIRFASDIVGGTAKNIEKIAFSDLVDFKKKFFVGQNFVCSVCSPLPAFKIKKMVEKTFINLRSSNAPMPKTHFKVNNVDKKSSFKYIDFEQEKVSVLLSFKVDKGERAVFFEDYNYMFLSKFISGARSGLFLKLRNRGLVYRFDADIASFCKNSLFDMFFETKQENIAEILEIISEEIEKIVNAGIDEEDVAEYKKNLKFADDERMPLKPASRCHSNFSDYICFGELFDIDKRKKKCLIATVSVEGATRAAREIFAKGNSVYVTVMGKVDKKYMPSLKHIGDKFLIYEK